MAQRIEKKIQEKIKRVEYLNNGNLSHYLTINHVFFIISLIFIQLCVLLLQCGDTEKKITIQKTRKKGVEN